MHTFAFENQPHYLVLNEKYKTAIFSEMAKRTWPYQDTLFHPSHSGFVVLSDLQPTSGWLLSHRPRGYSIEKERKLLYGEFAPGARSKDLNIFDFIISHQDYLLFIWRRSVTNHLLDLFRNPLRPLDQKCPNLSRQWTDKHRLAPAQ